MNNWYNKNMDLDYNEKNWANPCPKYDCRKAACKCGLEYVNIPTSLGDDSEGSNVAPKNGAYCNALVVYEANGHVYIYTKEGVPTLIDVDASDISTLEQEVRKAQRDIADFREDIDKFAYFFDTVADMSTSTQLSNGDYARTLGYHSKNDGGGAYYKIRTRGSGDVTNNSTLISINSLLVGELILNKDCLNVLQFGAYGDDTHDDTAAFQDCINFAYASKIKVINIPEGIYLISEPLEIYENKSYDLDFNYIEQTKHYLGYPVSELTFQGDNNNNTMIKCDAGDYLFNGYAEVVKGAQDLTFNNIYFNGNNIAKTTIQMNIVHFAGQEIKFNNCSFALFTECAIRHWYTEAMNQATPFYNILRLYLNGCNIFNNENGLIVGGDDTIINRCRIERNTKYGVIVYSDFHQVSIEGCKIQYNGNRENFVQGYDAGQIIFKGRGSTFNITNTYFENKSSNHSLNDTGVILFSNNEEDVDSTINNINIENCYINVSGAATVFEKISTMNIVRLNIQNNRIAHLKSDKPYLLTVNNELVDPGTVQQINSSSNFMTAKNLAGTQDIYYFYLINRSSYSRAGNIKSENGLWSPNTDEDLLSNIPTLISGAIGYNGGIRMKKIGSYNITKTGTGTYSIAFSRPVSLAGFGAADYPLFAQIPSGSKLDDARISNKTANGFDVTTGSWDNTFTTFTPADKNFDFIATFLTES